MWWNYCWPWTSCPISEVLWGFHLIGPFPSHLGLFTILHWFDLRGGEGSGLNDSNLLWNKVLPCWPLIPPFPALCFCLSLESLSRSFFATKEGTHVWDFPMSGAFIPLHSSHSKCLELLYWKLLPRYRPYASWYLPVPSPSASPPCCLLVGGAQPVSFKGNISKVFIGIHCGFNRNSGFIQDPGATWQN